MHLSQKSAAIFGFAISWLLIYTATVNCQVRSHSELVAAAREIITSARYCTLITIVDGKAESRTMDPLAPDDEFLIWFATNPLSSKVAEIRRNASVTAHYFDPASQAYVSIQGTARLVTEVAEKRRRWKQEWNAFYPDRNKVVLIAVKPFRMEVVNITKGIVGDTKTWQAPAVDFRQRRQHGR